MAASDGPNPPSTSDLQPEEQDLHRLLRADDAEKAIPELQRVLGPQLMRRLTTFFDYLPQEDREEVYLEALLRAWNKRATFDPMKGTLRGWVWTIARNVAYDKWRARNRKQRRAEQREERLRQARSSPEVGAYREAVLKVMNMLSPMQQKIVRADLEVLPDVADGGLLARVLGKDVASVHSQRNKAYARLERVTGLKRPRGLAP
ncbi:MAG: sigma-70 family RNA polymerase sigma factor [Planctomycetes bacterium]|nr:sigma-70 family RNA polymerase sigma factor [Planctomycetota bacterium]